MRRLAWLVLAAFLVLLAGAGAPSPAHHVPAMTCQFGIAHGVNGPQCSMPQPK